MGFSICSLKLAQGMDKDFLGFGTDIFTSEELSDTVYNVYMQLFAEEYRTATGVNYGKKDFSLKDIYYFYQNGIYVPCIERIAMVEYVDIDITGLPKKASIGFVEKDEINFSQIIPIKKLPYGHVPMGGTNYYKIINYYNKNNALESSIFFASVDNNGRIYPVKNTGYRNDATTTRFYAKSMAHLAWSSWAEADKENLWLVKTSESVLDTDFKTNLSLGVSEEHVKSLFYSRNTPTTSTGRKRPILHWVKSHQRRIKSGIDVDVSKHMRGIYKFEMDGMKYEITQPRKSKL